MTPTNTPSPAVAREEKRPEWITEIHDSEIFLIRNGPIYKGTQAGILFPSKEFEVSEIREAVAALNAHPVLTARIAALEKELEEAKRDFHEVLATNAKNAKEACELDDALTASREEAAGLRKALERLMKAEDASCDEFTAKEIDEIEAAMEQARAALATGDGARK